MFVRREWRMRWGKISVASLWEHISEFLVIILQLTATKRNDNSDDHDQVEGISRARDESEAGN